MYLKRKFPEGKIRDLVLKGYTESKRLSAPPEHTEDYPIDFVVLWVDENDPEWLIEKEAHSTQNYSYNSNYNSNARYRDWDMFHYWFRAVERYAPWVNDVFLITYGHVPKWLNTEHPKLKLVKHSDFISNEYLPTFSIVPIELNLWRIPQLSEHFVYYNDDMFLMNPVRKEDFFKDGLPKQCALEDNNNDIWCSRYGCTVLLC